MIISTEAAALPDVVARIFSEGERQPRMHPNGFIQLDIDVDENPCEPCGGSGEWKQRATKALMGTCPSCGGSGKNRIANKRLHVWPDNSDDFPRQEVRTSIHDHKFDMASEILIGELRQIRYHFSLDWEMLEGPTHQIYIARYNTRSDSTLEPTGAIVRLERISEEVYEEGDDYEQQASTFHDTECVGLTATLMTKVQEYEFHEPRVMVPIGAEPDNDFKRDNVDVDLLWDKIDEAMEALIDRINMGSSPLPGTGRKATR